jgi:transposase InsO family protein
VPWKVSHHVTERMHFVTRLVKGERMVDLCREFGISRKTGYKFWERFQREGVCALEDQSRARKRIGHKTPEAIEQLLVEARKAHNSWGGRKLKNVLEGQNPGVTLPSAGTIAAVLRRHGLVQARKLRRRPSRYTGKLTTAEAPNEVWAADYKGQFRLGNREYCYPLTATDLHSRFILAIDALDSTDEEQARVAFEDAFAKYGLPLVIRTDNGSPFASAHGLAGLTRLSAFWLRLGIKHERTEPAHPEQNGQHERMHRTLKAETTRPARSNLMQQQERFDDFRQEFNEQRPHEALAMKRPAEVYCSSNRQLPKPLPELNYPLHDDAVTVGRGGHIRLPRGRQAFLSGALVHQTVGLREEIDGRWLVTFASLDLGTYDPRTGSFDPVSPPPPAAKT